MIFKRKFKNWAKCSFQRHLKFDAQCNFKFHTKIKQILATRGFQEWWFKCIEMRWWVVKQEWARPPLPACTLPPWTPRSSRTVASTSERSSHEKRRTFCHQRDLGHPWKPGKSIRRRQGASASLCRCLGEKSALRRRQGKAVRSIRLFPDWGVPQRRILRHRRSGSCWWGRWEGKGTPVCQIESRNCVDLCKYRLGHWSHFEYLVTFLKLNLKLW